MVNWERKNKSSCLKGVKMLQKTQKKSVNRNREAFRFFPHIWLEKKKKKKSFRWELLST